MEPQQASTEARARSTTPQTFGSSEFSAPPPTASWSGRAPRAASATARSGCRPRCGPGGPPGPQRGRHPDRAVALAARGQSEVPVLVVVTRSGALPDGLLEAEHGVLALVP